MTSRNESSRVYLALAATLATIAAVALAPGRASAAVSTYRYQISNGQQYSGFTTSWADACPASAGTNLTTDTTTRITTMTTAAFGCQFGRLNTTQAGGSFVWLQLINPTPYASNMTVTGQTTGNRITLRNSGGAGTMSVRIDLGYVTGSGGSGGSFTAFGAGVAINGVSTTATLYQPNMSGLTGTVPAGSSLAIRVVLTSNSSGNNARIYVANDNSGTDASLTFAVDETVASNTLTIGNGSADPTAGTVLPAGSTNNVLDTFTLQATTNVTAQTIGVSLTGNAAFSSVWLSKSNTCLPVLGTAQSGPGASVSFGGLAEAVTTTQSANYYVCGTVSASLASATSVSANVSTVTTNGTGTWILTDNDVGPTLSAQPKVTVGNGASEPTNSSITKDATAALDAFTLTPSGGTASVTGIAVTFTGGGTAAATVSVNTASSCAAASSLGSVTGPASPTGTVTVPVTISLSAATSYWVCITAGTVAATTTVTGTVSSVTAAGYASATNDTTSATVTVTAPPSVTVGNGTAEPGNGSIAQGQTSAMDAFSLLRSAGTASVTGIAVTFTGGGTAAATVSVNSASTCAAASSLGSVAGPATNTGTVTVPVSISVTSATATNYWVCITGATVATSTNVSGTVSDLSVLGYSVTDNDTTTSTITVSPPTITIGNGASEPTGTSITQDGTAALDAFTLTPNTGTASVTGIAVTFSGGGTAAATVSINTASTCAAASSLGAVTGPATNTGTVTVPATVSLSAATSYWVCITAGTVGFSTTVTGNVSSVTAAGYASTDSDTTNATVTVTVPPSVTVGNGTAEPGNGSIAQGQTDAMDAFSLLRSAGTASVTGVAVTFTGGGTAAATVSINSANSCAAATSLGSVAGPATNTGTVTVPVAISVTSATATNYWVCITGATVAASTNVSGTVSDLSVLGYSVTDNDTTTSTITVAPPTITIGNGASEPTSTSITKDGTAALDAFVLTPSTGTASVTGIAVTFSGGGTAAATVSINTASSCAAASSLGSVTGPATNTGTVTVPLTVSLSASTSYWVCITADQVAATATVTGTVSGVTAVGYATTDNDTTSATLTVTVPPSVTVGNGSEPGNGTIILGQTAAMDAFSLLRSTGTASVTGIAVTFTGGGTAAATVSVNSASTCAAASSLGSVAGPATNTGTVTVPVTISVTSFTATNYWVCVTAGTVAGSTAVAGTVSGLSVLGYSVADNDTTSSTVTVNQPALTAGNGASEPANSTIVYGQTGALDAFSLTPAAGTASVTGIAVTFTAGGTAAAAVSINTASSCAAASSLGSVAGPATSTGTVTVPVAVSLSAATSYWVCITAGAVGASTTVTGTVSGATASGYAFTDNDTTNATVTVSQPVITIGNGTEPSGSSITKDGTAALDAFSLSATAGTTPSITGISVAFTGGGTAAATVSINTASTCAAASSLGSVAGPATNTGTVIVPVAITLSSTTSYWVCLTAGTVAASTAVTGTVSTVAATGFGATDNDTASATVTVTVPPSVTVGNATEPGNSTILLAQVAAMDAFSLARSAGTANVTGIAVTFTAGGTAAATVSVNSASTCAAASSLGSVGGPATNTGTVTVPVTIAVTSTTATNYWVCITGGTVAASTSVTGTVSGLTVLGYTVTDSDTTTSTVTVSPPTLTIGNGTEPGNVSITKDATAAMDAFVLSPSSGTANVTAVSVAFTAGGTAAATVSINSASSCAAASSLGAVAGPATNTGTVTVSVSASVSAPASYWVCITAGTVAASTPVTGTVSTVTAAGFTVTDSDTTSSTVTVTAPPAITIGNGTEPGASSVGAGTTAAMDAFTLQAAAGAGVVTSAVVTFTAGGTAVTAVSLNSASSCAPASSLGSVAAPLSDTGSVTIPVSIGVGTTSVAYYVCVTGGFVGANTAVTGTVASVTAAGYGYTDNDTTSATVTVSASTPAGSTNPSAPMVAIANPKNGATVSSTATYLVQIRVFNPTTQSGLSGLVANSVQLSTDNGTTWPATCPGDARCATRNTLYDSGTTATIFEVRLASPAAGSYILRARASNAAVTNVVSDPVTVRSVAASGDGTLLVRDNSSQLCTDCHAVKAHSSESLGTVSGAAGSGSKYGAWSTNCRDCHSPHGTRNIFVVSEHITPPSVAGVQVPKNVGFVKTTGDSGAPGWSGSGPTATASFANSDNTGPCQVCHTRTVDPNAASPQPARWRNTGNADIAHYQASGPNGTTPCTACHSHNNGFAAGEPPLPASRCSGCHSTIWNMVKTGGLANAHRIDLDSADTSLDWSAQAVLTTVPSAQRNCLNMCHGDHPHDLTSPATVTHEGNLYADPSTNAARGAASVNRVGPGGTGTVNRAKTDFDPTANDGLCVKCHQKPIVTGGITVTAASYGASAHDYASNAYGAWTYTLHDGSTFARNCTKCHAATAEGTTPGYGSTATRGYQTVHGNANDSLLAGTKKPAGSAAGFVCYNCHGSTASPGAGVQGNRSGKDIQSQIVHATTAGQSGHPANSDSAHDSAAEYANASYGNALGVAAGAGQRHASCMDCHETHTAKAGTHAVGTNVAGPPLQGAWGAQLSLSPAFWTTPTAANFTKKVIAAGADLEATLCFKCHTTYYWGAGTPPTSPSGSFAETDTAKEFNPANTGNYAGAWVAGDSAGSYHPVLATAASNLGAVNLANLVTTNIPWSTTTRNLMTCSDCHESDVTTDPNGPHGSAARFILRGPNTTWANTVINSSSGMPAGTFCANCHSSSFSNSRYSGHTNGHHNIACFYCHSAVPHGGPRPGLLIADGGSSMAAPNGPGIAGWDQVAPYNQAPTANNGLYLKSYPASNTSGWGQSNCGCGTGGGH